MASVVVERPVSDVLTAARWQGVEDGWVLVGEVRNGDVHIADLIDAGPNAERGSEHMSFDNEHVMERFREKAEGTFIAGTAHTHPQGRPNPSEGDFLTLLSWVRRLRMGFGIFCVISDGIPLWFMLEAGGEEFKPLSVTYA